MIFTHSGHLGDVIYSLPTISYFVGGQKEAVLYIKERNERDLPNLKYTQYDALAELMKQQPCIKEVHPFAPHDNNWSDHYWPGLKFDIDLDDARYQRQRGLIFHLKRYFDQFNVPLDYKKCFPFLKIDDEYPAKIRYALFHVTARWHGYAYDWKLKVNEARMKYDRIYFTGYEEDHQEFQTRYNVIIDHLKTKDLLELARLIRDCQAIYCNQNSALVIAQGLQKEYFLCRNINKTNCHAGTFNEHIL